MEENRWCSSIDCTEPVITAKDHVGSCHLRIPETAIIFFMSRGVEYLCEKYNAREFSEQFPRFLDRCPIWEIDKYGVCFLDGGRGAPQACDTIETLAALGVKNVIAVGMMGAFDHRLSVGEIIAPEKAFVEEGTSLHYCESIDYAAPDSRLHRIAADWLNVKAYPIVSTDAVYRQTFYKEELWRNKGVVGIDMEMSAVFSVSRHLGINAVGMLMASDIHPINPEAPKWEWRMTNEMRWSLAEKSVELANHLC